MKKTIMLFAAFLLFCAATADAGGIIVIANKESGTASLSVDEVQRIFLGKKTVWENGKKIIPVCLKGGRKHETFLRAFLDLTPSQFDTFWKQAVFTGTGRPPKSFESEEELIQFVKSTAGGVGYIDSDTGHSAVRAISVK